MLLTYSVNLSGIYFEMVKKQNTPKPIRSKANQSKIRKITARKTVKAAKLA